MNQVVKQSCSERLARRLWGSRHSDDAAVDGFAARLSLLSRSGLHLRPPRVQKVALARCGRAPAPAKAAMRYHLDTVWIPFG